MRKLPSIVAASIIGLGLTSESESIAKEKSKCDQAIQDTRDIRLKVEKKVDEALKETEKHKGVILRSWGQVVKNSLQINGKLKMVGKKCRQETTGETKRNFQSMLEEVTVTIAKLQWLEEIIKNRKDPKNLEPIPEYIPKTKPRKKGIAQNEKLALN